MDNDHGITGELREFGKAWVEWEDGSPYDPIAKFAAKLQLKEEA